MLFNSFEFLLFFPIVAFLFFAIKHKYRWLWLLSASCFFYMFFKPVYILILLLTIIIDYYAGIAIEKQEKQSDKKKYLVLSIVANVLVLAIFKYFNFLNLNIGYFLNIFDVNNPIPFLEILLPIGLSFHTFQAMSYTIEVYRGNQKAEKHFGYYSLYVMFFPQLVAGPIERPQNVLHQFHEEKFYSYDNAVIGLRLILLGLVKKVVIADNLSVVVNNVYLNLDSQNSITLWITAIFFSIQIYCDFSGYSDMALGTAKFMGFDLMKNFNKPYFSYTIKDFWSRWHISLSSWFRDYLYIPLGGNRTTKLKQYRNTLIVFMLSGLWHGANFTFIVWGLIHGLLVCITSFFTNSKKMIISKQNFIIKVVSICFLFIIVSVAWVYFRAATISDANYVVSKLFFDLPTSINYLLNGKSIFAPLQLESSKELLWLLSLPIFMLLLDYVMSIQNVKNFFNSKSWFRYLVYSMALTLIVFFGYTEESQFIYFQF